MIDKDKLLPKLYKLIAYIAMEAAPLDFLEEIIEEIRKGVFDIEKDKEGEARTNKDYENFEHTLRNSKLIQSMNERIEYLEGKLSKITPKNPFICKHGINESLTQCKKCKYGPLSELF